MNEFMDTKPWRRCDNPKLLLGHSQMGTSQYFCTRHLLITHRSRFDRVRVRPGFLNRRLQRLRKFVWK